MAETSSPSQIRFQRCRLVRLDARGSAAETTTLRQHRIVIGSAPDCDVCLHDPTVSRQHFSIERSDEAHIIRDMGSTNGTHVNDLKIREAFLSPGALIRAGESRFRFELDFRTPSLAPFENDRFGRVIGSSPRMRQIFSALGEVAPSDETVLLQGPAHTGKRTIARALHEKSRRRDGPFVVLDCGAFVPAALDSELFGHEEGAFTDANERYHGALEGAAGGTLLINDLEELPLDLQPKLLRAFEDRKFTRMGGREELPFDCRIVATSQTEVWDAVVAGRLRRDLYFRLAAVTIEVPPLCDRSEDIPALIDHFLGQSAVLGKRFAELPSEARERILRHEWPGNLRELRNVAERMARADDLAAGLELLGQDVTRVSPIRGARRVTRRARVDFSQPYAAAKSTAVESFEREYFGKLLRRNEGDLERAAKEAELALDELQKLLDRYGLT